MRSPALTGRLAQPAPILVHPIPSHPGYILICRWEREKISRDLRPERTGETAVRRLEGWSLKAGPRRVRRRITGSAEQARKTLDLHRGELQNLPIGMRVADAR